MKIPLFAAALLGCGMLAAAPAAPAAPAGPAPAPANQPVPVFRKLFPSNLNAADYADPVEASRLIHERELLIRDMMRERRKIIESDGKAKELHAKILELNKELAVLVENKRAILDLTLELRQLDGKIDALKPKAAEPPPATAEAKPTPPATAEAKPTPPAAKKPAVNQ